MRPKLIKILLCVIGLAAQSAIGSTLKSVKAITAAARSTCAILSTGEVKCWGDNFSGELGQGDNIRRGTDPDQMGDSLVAVDLGNGRTAKQISASYDHVCAILDNNSVKCWGRNAAGQLGLGDTQNRGREPGQMGDLLPAVDLGTGRTALAIAAGMNHTCAILDDHSLKCWGSGLEGQLGLGSQLAYGQDPNKMGDALPTVNLGTNRHAVAIGAGQYHSCALLDDGTVKCWGKNYYGELGLGSSAAFWDTPGSMGDRLPAVRLGTGLTAKAITVDGMNSCALLRDNSVKCWGGCSTGVPGISEDRYTYGDRADDMGDALPPVDLGTGRGVNAIFLSIGHVCAVFDDSSFKCWGYNGAGELGLGDKVRRGVAAQQMGDNLPTLDFRGLRALASAGGFAHTCAILNNGGVKCWGSNIYGELGLGDTAGRGGAPGEMVNLPFVKLWD